MRIQIREGDDTPLYQQIVNSISRDIASGTLTPGYKLPTVRDLADESGISRGTVKHAYDRLEQMGLIEMTQGRGTFVCQREVQDSASKKDQAMKAIDHMLDELQSLSFSMRDVRIFFDLKMREREEQFALVRVGVVDCSPESTAVICSQLSTLPGIEIQPYLLDEVLQSPEKLDGGLDLIVTTASHFSDLEYKVPPGSKLMRLVLSPSPNTVLELARLPATTRVGVVSASAKFAGIMRASCEQYAVLEHAPDLLYLGQGGDIVAFDEQHDVLMLPIHYHQFCTAQETAAIGQYLAEGGAVIYFDYQIDRGSLLYIGEQVESITSANHGGFMI